MLRKVFSKLSFSLQMNLAYWVRLIVTAEHGWEAWLGTEKRELKKWNNLPLSWFVRIQGRYLTDTNFRNKNASKAFEDRSKILKCSEKMYIYIKKKLHKSVEDCVWWVSKSNAVLVQQDLKNQKQHAAGFRHTIIMWQCWCGWCSNVDVLDTNMCYCLRTQIPRTRAVSRWVDLPLATMAHNVQLTWIKLSVQLLIVLFLIEPGNIMNDISSIG